MKAVADTLGVARSHLAERLSRPVRPRGLYHKPEDARLLLTICYENISTGLALAAFVAFLSGIVSKKFAAVQYAVLSSLTFLIGSLGKGLAGEMIERDGYASVFRDVALVGLLAILFVLLEWWRASRQPKVDEPGDTGGDVDVRDDRGRARAGCGGDDRRPGGAHAVVSSSAGIPAKRSDSGVDVGTRASTSW